MILHIILYNHNSFIKIKKIMLELYFKPGPSDEFQFRNEATYLNFEIHVGRAIDSLSPRQTRNEYKSVPNSEN